MFWHTINWHVSTCVWLCPWLAGRDIVSWLDTKNRRRPTIYNYIILATQQKMLARSSMTQLPKSVPLLHCQRFVFCIAVVVVIRAFDAEYEKVWNREFWQNHCNTKRIEFFIVYNKNTFKFNKDIYIYILRFFYIFF